MTPDDIAASSPERLREALAFIVEERDQTFLDDSAWDKIHAAVGTGSPREIAARLRSALRAETPEPTPSPEREFPIPPFALREAIIDAVRNGERDPVAGVTAFDAYDEWWYARLSSSKDRTDD